MIHSARLTVSPALNIIFTWNLFCYFLRSEDGRTDGRTNNMCENNDRDCGTAEWIKNSLISLPTQSGWNSVEGKKMQSKNCEEFAWERKKN